MFSPFRFLRPEGREAELDAEFRAASRQSGATHLAVGFALTAAIFLSFYLLDHVHAGLPLLGGVQTVRLALVVAISAAAVVCASCRARVAKHYVWIANLAILGVMSAVAVVASSARVHLSTADIYWGLTSSLCIGVVVAYGFTRLTLRNTAVTVGAASCIGLVHAAQLPASDVSHLARMALQLATVNLVACVLRRTLERRERQLFDLARDPLRHNLPSQVLEADPSADGGATLQPVRVNLPEVCRVVAERHTIAARAKGIELRTRLDLGATDQDVRVDEAKLTTVLDHLVSNAVKFTSQGFVEIGAQLLPAPDGEFPRARLELEVRDTGIGIPLAEQATVLLRADRIEPRDDPAARRTGFGLATVAALIERMGGTVELLSTERLGTRVRVMLPVIVVLAARTATAKATPAAPTLYEVNDAPRRQPAPPSRPKPLSGRVLLVEDNELNAMRASRLLEQFGLQVSVAENGREAIQAHHDHAFDLLLMDCQMPTMDGYAATWAIRERERQDASAPVPIIALTANALAGERERCLAAGMSDYLAKPYAERQLNEMLSRWLEAEPASRPVETQRAALAAGRNLRLIPKRPAD